MLTEKDKLTVMQSNLAAIEMLAQKVIEQVRHAADPAPEDYDESRMEPPQQSRKAAQPGAKAYRPEPGISNSSLFLYLLWTCAACADLLYPLFRFTGLRYYQAVVGKPR